MANELYEFDKRITRSWPDIAGYKMAPWGEWFYLEFKRSNTFRSPVTKVGVNRNEKIWEQ